MHQPTHSLTPAAANFGGVLIVFGGLFGTYAAGRDELPCTYGLVHSRTSYNRLHVERAEWFRLARDLYGAGSLRAFFGHLFMPPDRAPRGEGSTTAELRQRAARETRLPSRPTSN
jgi:hypothetical protein